MTYLSILAILPKFLWKQIAYYMCPTDIGRVRCIADFRIAFDDEYCKQYLLNNTVEDIIAIITKSTNDQHETMQIDGRFWDHALVYHYKFDYISDLFEFIGRKKFRNFAYINIFIKAGIYDIGQNTSLIFDMYDFFNKKCSVTINGSTYGQTIITSSYTMGWRFCIPLYLLFENIIFDTDCVLKDIENIFDECVCTTASLKLTNCIFNKWINLGEIQYITILSCKFSKTFTLSRIHYAIISNCEFSYQCDLIKIHNITISNCEFSYQCDLIKIHNIIISNCKLRNHILLCTTKNSTVSCCVFNPGSLIKIRNTSVDFNNNTVQQQCTFLIEDINNNTITIQGNTISNCDAFISFYQYSHKNGTTQFIIKNNYLTNIPTNQLWI